ncbi:DcaP family trimeric outer membrane transporter [Salicola sp. Rm-C-2C1-2]|uniref:DcaP family trimeric outer membrane transporter n=1 Tax=Salicola sp. Rm-C-2C1-2 TaxID=3141321 RepID=UPI0032E3A001
MNKKLSVTALAIAIGAASSGVQAQSLEERISALENSPLADTNLDVGGFIKLDSHFTRMTDGDSSASQEFLVPFAIREGGDNSNINYNTNAKQSRIFFKTTTDTDIGEVGTYIEMDFRGQGGNENVANSYDPRLRHAFMTFQNFTIGQTWSTFHDVSVLPENLDFVGPVGTIFNRQAQIRYSPGNWDFAIENPQSNLQDDLYTGNATNFDNGSMPDLVARYNVPMDSGHASVAVLGREVSYEGDFDSNQDSREKAYGYGVSLSAKMPVGDEGSDIRAQLNGGNLGRYIALSAFDPGYIDSNGDVELINQMGGYVSYRQVWTSQWRSNFTVSHVSSDNDDEMGNVMKSASSAHANLIYSPISNLDLGGEVIWGDKEMENGSSGELHRLQFTATLGF